jgi:uncharacterized protein YacL
MIFKDISSFNNINDYLPILTACINVDLIVIFCVYHGLIKSKYLKSWYRKFNLSAVIADVLILVIGIIIARYIYKYLFKTFNIWLFTGLAVVIQIIHDILFYLFFNNIPLGYNYMLDFFKLYAKEVGAGAILGDSSMMILSCLLSSYLANFNTNSNIINLIISCYFIPYMIYYEK